MQFLSPVFFRFVAFGNVATETPGLKLISPGVTKYTGVRISLRKFDGVKDAPSKLLIAICLPCVLSLCCLRQRGYRNPGVKEIISPGVAKHTGETN